MSESAVRATSPFDYLLQKEEYEASVDEHNANNALKKKKDAFTHPNQPEKNKKNAITNNTHKKTRAKRAKKQPKVDEIVDDKIADEVVNDDDDDDGDDNDDEYDSDAPGDDDANDD